MAPALGVRHIKAFQPRRHKPSTGTKRPWARAAGGATLAIALFLVLLWRGLSPGGPAENRASGPISVNMAVAQLNAAYKDRLAELQAGDYHDIQFQGGGPDWNGILAVFACKVTQGDGTDALSTLDEEQAAQLEQVFDDMVLLSAQLTRIQGENYAEEVLTLTAGTRSPEEMATVYNFTGAQKKALADLLARPEVLAGWRSDLDSLHPDGSALLAALPGGLSPERRAVVEAACSLVGKVNYFWGGKSRVLGWDGRWGGVRKVTASGSVSSGLYRPYGLDCSGFVDWVFFNASGGQYLISQGGGARAQHKACQDIAWEDALPGDLAFYPEDEHIGIVGGRDSQGDLLVIHCTSGENNVVVTTADDFTSLARPLWFSGALPVS